jgi:hypothetical protein
MQPPPTLRACRRAPRHEMAAAGAVRRVGARLQAPLAQQNYKYSHSARHQRYGKDRPNQDQFPKADSKHFGIVTDQLAVYVLTFSPSHCLPRNFPAIIRVLIPDQSPAEVQGGGRIPSLAASFIFLRPRRAPPGSTLAGFCFRLITASGNSPFSSWRRIGFHTHACLD